MHHTVFEDLNGLLPKVFDSSNIVSTQICNSVARQLSDMIQMIGEPLLSDRPCAACRRSKSFVASCKIAQSNGFDAVEGYEIKRDELMTSNTSPLRQAQINTPVFVAPTMRAHYSGDIYPSSSEFGAD
jgi:hypothetical protein